MTGDVVIVGAGPTGLMLAAELAMAGVRPLVLERLAEPTGLSKALGILGRAVDVLDNRGLLDRLREYEPADPPVRLHFGMIPLDVAGLDDVGLRGAFVRQADTERVLEERVHELGVEIRRGQEVTGLRQDGDGVDLDVSGTPLHARYVVGCDGGRSAVRRLAGIDFPGLPPTRLARLGEVELAGDPPAGIGLFPVDSSYYRVVSSEPYPPGFDRAAPMTVDELQASIRRTTGQDLAIRRARWLTRFTDASRQAARYRAGRVLLAGDAAHLHSPAGGPGINTGLLDAVNLGWKLAATVHGSAPDGLLDTYHDDRHPEGERVLRFTRAQMALLGDGQHVPALREVLGRLFDDERTRRDLVTMMYGLDARYGATDGDGLVGRWMPDLALTTVDGPTRVAELLRTPTAVLLDLGGLGIDVDGWADRLRVVEARCDRPPASAVLIRPDGHVAWTGSRDDVPALREALTTWLGPARQVGAEV
jgi:2-polyprenyl-6-methoxyphenol hydroxylase-like FAD-dependent oxidoreductase